ncbi:degenerate transposase (orf1) [Streptococcus pneumoniae]|nr:degenerate transposase (orf1) [Streptococcus pneumoniae]
MIYPVLISFYYSSMNYEGSKQLTDARFKCLVGVQRTTFEEMLAVLKTAYQLKHAKGGRKPKLSLEDLLMATLTQIGDPYRRQCLTGSLTGAVAS